MESFFAAVGAFVVVVGGFFLLLRYIDKKDEIARDNRDLAKYVDNIPRDPHRSFDQNLKKALSDSNVREKAEQRRKDAIEFENKMAEENRKRQITKRVYSYDYECLIYQIFAPFRTKNECEEKWSYDKLEKKFVINEIARIKEITLDQAGELFLEMKEKGLIEEYQMKCKIGMTLDYYWNVVSDEDLNFSKWVNSQTYIESREDADRRRRSI